MREIEIKFMGRHIGTLGHEAHVTQRAGVNDGLVIGRRHAVQFATFTIVDQVKKFWKTVTQIKTASTAMADIEDTGQFGLNRLHVVIGFILPVNRMPGGSLGAAFFWRPFYHFIADNWEVG